MAAPNTSSITSAVNICTQRQTGRMYSPSIYLKKIHSAQAAKEIDIYKDVQTGSGIFKNQKQCNKVLQLYESSIMNLKALFPDSRTEIRYTGLFGKTS